MTILDYIERLVTRISSLEDEISSLKEKIRSLELNENKEDFSLKNFTLGE